MLYRYSLDSCPHCNAPNWTSNDMGYDPRDWIYDCETYPMVFTMSALHASTGEIKRFEISYRQDDRLALQCYLYDMNMNNHRMIGFNNVGFDYPILHEFINSGYQWRAHQLYTKAQSIIDTPWSNRFDNIIWDHDRYIEQLDLFLIHHFDNSARSTSLKQLEFAMRSENIQDLPYKPGSFLQPHEVDHLIEYNDNDVFETFEFYKHSIEMIEFREGLTEKYDKSFMNHNDAKIGKDITILKLGDDLCFHYENGKKKPNQTHHPTMDLQQAIFPYIQFKQQEFDRIKLWLSHQVITETKGVFKDLNCTVDGLKYVFGLGGLHASVPGQTLHSNHEYVIIDVDVTAFYPSEGIANNIYPHHLGGAFPRAVAELKAERLMFAKGTLENAAYKLAMNAGFGNSNNKHTPFYDPMYTMTITINGQLLLCMLAEWLLQIDSLSIIQANTDGITARLKRTDVEAMRSICRGWELFTKLDLEEATYSSMYIRDVNNYIAVYEDGKLKRKGAYEYKKEWHKDHSALIVPKAVEAALIHHQDPKEFILNHQDIYDFMLFAKAPGGSRLELGGVEIQRRSRYCVTKTGLELKTISPPTGVMGEFKKANGVSKSVYDAADNTVHNPEIHTKNESKHTIRSNSICSSWLVSDCNNLKDFDRTRINYEYYIQEATKLIQGVTLGS